MPSLREFPRRTSKSRNFLQRNEDSANMEKAKRRKLDNRAKASKAYSELKTRHDWTHKKASGLGTWKFIAKGCSDKDEEGKCWFNGYESLAFHLEKVGWDIEKIVGLAKDSNAPQRSSQSFSSERAAPVRQSIAGANETIAPCSEAAAEHKVVVQPETDEFLEQRHREMDELPLQKSATQERQQADAMTQKDISRIVHLAEVTLFGETCCDGSLLERLEFLEEEVGLGASPAGAPTERARQVIAVIGEQGNDGNEGKGMSCGMRLQ